VINPQEFTLIIRGWLDNKSELLMSASSINFSVLAKCRVVDVAGDKVTLWSLKEDSVFTFSVESPHLSVKYSEPRDFPEFFASLPEDKQFKSAILISLPLEELVPEAASMNRSVEKIVLMEL
jgi:hypothetical protein